MTIIDNIKRTLINLPGFRTNRKIVVIESDDWGSIRMPSKEVYNTLVNSGIRVDNLEYNRYDSLASETDLEALFEVLHSVKDCNGKPAIMTANTIVANPDFDKIRENNFETYYYEPFIETLKRYPQHSKSFELWKAGIKENVFQPQFHGREHLNVTRWMKDLKLKKANAHIAFNFRMYDLSVDKYVGEDTYVESLMMENENELEVQKEILTTGLDLFENIFGFRSRTFIAPCYIWSSKLNKTLFENGVDAFQGNWFQLEPTPGKSSRYKRKMHYLGETNSIGQIYLTRNIPFEPSKDKKYNWVSEALKRIEIAFKCGKPAVINTHRVNYIGYLELNNRTQNLYLLKVLLDEIIRKWPDVEFMSSDKLIDIIKNR